jgi:cytochrome c-type biogenesis protein CcmH
VRLAAVLAVLALAFAAPALASEQHPSQSELEAELVCPTCHTTLDESDSPVARQMKAYIRMRIAAGATKSQIIDELVGPPNNMGKAVLGVPSKHGFDLLAWLLPFVGIALGAVILGGAAWYWSRNRAPDGTAVSATTGPPLEPELERRVDEELARFDA